MTEKKLQKLYENHTLIKEIYNRVSSQIRDLPEGWYCTGHGGGKIYKHKTVEAEGETVELKEKEFIEPSRTFKNDTSMVTWGTKRNEFMFYDLEDGGFVLRIYGVNYQYEDYDMIISPTQFIDIFYKNFYMYSINNDDSNTPKKAYEIFYLCNLITKKECKEATVFLTAIGDYREQKRILGYRKKEADEANKKLKHIEKKFEKASVELEKYV